MPREVTLTKESTFRLCRGECTALRTSVSRINITVEEEGEISRVIECLPDGKEHSYGRDKLRSELGETGWLELLNQIGATS